VLAGEVYLGAAATSPGLDPMLAPLARGVWPSTATVMGRGEGSRPARRPFPSTPGQARFTDRIRCFQKSAASAYLLVGHDHSINDEKSPHRFEGMGKANDSSTRLRRARASVQRCP